MRIKYLLPVYAAIILQSLSACSSGSSNAPGSETSTNTVPAVTNSEVEQETQLNNNANEQQSSDDNPNAPGDDDTPGQNGIGIIDPESPLGQLEARVQTLASTAIRDLNRSINQGELLSAQQDECIGAFDPALGQPLLNVHCEQAISVEDSPIYLHSATLQNAPECLASLQNNELNGCWVNQAELTINTLWFVPPTEPGQPERPQPKAGAHIMYGLVPDRLSFDNLENALSGLFSCAYELAGEPSADTNSGVNGQSNCDDQALRIVALIDEHLANRNL